MATKYRTHLNKWFNCRRCASLRKKQVVLLRGKIPAPILFVGEAPGVSEDVIGIPFVGPAGKLLDRMLEEGLDGQVDYCITNLVACIPRVIGEDKMEAPTEESIYNCRERLEEVFTICNPVATVAVGKLAEKWLPSNFGENQLGKMFSVIHPAAILRLDISQKSLAIQRNIVTISEVADYVLGED